VEIYLRFSNIRISELEFVSDFELRISDLATPTTGHS